MEDRVDIVKDNVLHAFKQSDKAFQNTLIAVAAFGELKEILASEEVDPDDPIAVRLQYVSQRPSNMPLLKVMFVENPEVCSKVCQLSIKISKFLELVPPLTFAMLPKYFKDHNITSAEGMMRVAAGGLADLKENKAAQKKAKADDVSRVWFYCPCAVDNYIFLFTLNRPRRLPERRRGG